MQAPVPFFGPTRKASKGTFFSLVGYWPAPHPEARVVHDFHLDNSAYQFISAPARTSKSYASAPEAAHDFFPDIYLAEGEVRAHIDETRILIVGINYDTVKEWDYCWSYLVDSGLVEKLGGVFEQKANTPNQGNMVIRVRWPFRTREGRVARSILMVKSAANAPSIQGDEWKTCVLSEAAEHEERTVRKYLITRCSRIIFPTTPKRRALWLYEWFQRGFDNPESRTAHFQFNRYCNPTYDHERYETARLQAELTYGSATDDPEFMEQFEGVWTFEGGKVIPFRWLAGPQDPPTNVIRHGEEPPWLPYATVFVSCDDGYNDPAVALFWAIGPDDQKVIFDEVYERHLEPQQLVDRIREREAAHQVTPQWYVPDPQRPVLKKVLRRNFGLRLYDRIKPSKVRDVAAGYTLLRGELAVDPAIGMPRLRVHERCQRTIQEWKEIRFKEGAANEFSHGSIANADHAADAARYGLMSNPRFREDRGDWTVPFVKEHRARKRRRELAQAPPLVGMAPSSMLGAA